MRQTTAERFEKVKTIYSKALEQQPVARDIRDVPVSYELISDEWLTPAPGSPDMQPAETSLEFIKHVPHAIDDLDALSTF